MGRTETALHTVVETGEFIRAATGLTQREFAERIGVSKRTLENWEQGRRVPQGPARALLLLLGKDPEAVLKRLAA